MKRLAKINAYDDFEKEEIFIEMNEDTFEVSLSNGDDVGETSTNEKNAMEIAGSWSNYKTFKWLI